MAFVITEPCKELKDSGCVDVCPVDCIHPRYDDERFAAADQLFIDPEECIDCAACVAACPVQAIYPLDEVPQRWEEYIDLNRRWFESSGNPKSTL